MAKGNRRSIKVLHKLRAINMYKRCRSLRKVSRRLKIDRCMLRRWVRKEEALWFTKEKTLRSNIQKKRLF